MDERVEKKPTKVYRHVTESALAETVDNLPLPPELTPEAVFQYALESAATDLSQVKNSVVRNRLYDSIAKLLSTKAIKGGVVDKATRKKMMGALESMGSKAAGA